MFEYIEELVSSHRKSMTFHEINNNVKKLKSAYFDVEASIYQKVIHELSLDSRKNVKSLSENLSKFIEKTRKEILRVRSMYEFDAKFGNCIYTAGTDEVGRGPLAGPIAAAAVVLDIRHLKDSELILGIKDSKKLARKKREEIAEIIKKRAVSYSIAVVNNDKIDQRGISWCNNEVLRRSVEGINVPVNMVLSDGYAVNNLGIDNEFIIKGDCKSASIAAASIIAKVYRDNLMDEYSLEFPMYNFSRNSGYGTKEHIEAIRKYGTCRLHRRSFLKNII